MMNKLKTSENAKLKEKCSKVVQMEAQFLRNLGNAGREMNALYAQNQDLFSQQKEYRDELEVSEEKVRQLTKIVKSQPDFSIEMAEQIM